MLPGEADAAMRLDGLGRDERERLWEQRGYARRRRRPGSPGRRHPPGGPPHGRRPRPARPGPACRRSLCLTAWNDADRAGRTGARAWRTRPTSPGTCLARRRPRRRAPGRRGRARGASAAPAAPAAPTRAAVSGRRSRRRPAGCRRGWAWARRRDVRAPPRSTAKSAGRRRCRGHHQDRPRAERTAASMPDTRHPVSDPAVRGGRSARRRGGAPVVPGGVRFGHAATVATTCPAAMAGSELGAAASSPDGEQRWPASTAAATNGMQASAAPSSSRTTWSTGQPARAAERSGDDQAPMPSSPATRPQRGIRGRPRRGVEQPPRLAAARRAEAHLADGLAQRVSASLASGS